MNEKSQPLRTDGPTLIIEKYVFKKQLLSALLETKLMVKKFENFKFGYNQPIKVSKAFVQANKISWLKTLFTSVIYSPISPQS